MTRTVLLFGLISGDARLANAQDNIDAQADYLSTLMDRALNNALEKDPDGNYPVIDLPSDVSGDILVQPPLNYFGKVCRPFRYVVRNLEIKLTDSGVHCREEQGGNGQQWLWIQDAALTGKEDAQDVVTLQPTPAWTSPTPPVPVQPKPVTQAAIPPEPVTPGPVQSNSAMPAPAPPNSVVPVLIRPKPAIQVPAPPNQFTAVPIPPSSVTAIPVPPQPVAPVLAPPNSVTPIQIAPKPVIQVSASQKPVTPLTAQPNQQQNWPRLTDIGEWVGAPIIGLLLLSFLRRRKKRRTARNRTEDPTMISSSAWAAPETETPEPPPASPVSSPTPPRRAEARALPPGKWTVLELKKDIAYLGCSGPLRIRVLGGSGLYSALELGKFQFPDRLNGSIELLPAGKEAVTLRIYYK